MSYCRWSSDDWKSDVYVYADIDGGFTTMVAGHRYKDALPPLKIEGEPAIAWLKRMADSRVSIDLDGAGDTHNDKTAGECIGRLRVLRKTGFHVPQCAIDRLREEQAEDCEYGGSP